MDSNTFIANFVDSIEGLEDASLSPETRLADLEAWDSLAILTTIAMVDTEYEVEVSGTELNQCSSLGDIIALVESKQNA